MSPPDAVRLRRWQTLTVGVLFAGYAGYYVCRSNLSVATPLLVADPALGVSKAWLGTVASAGLMAYAAGKLVNGFLADRLGGRLLFLVGLFGSAGCVALLPLLPPASGGFLLGWAANRFAQSMGWGGVVQLAARWFPADRLGTVMGFLCMSYLLGDAAARLFLGGLVRAGADWKGLFVGSAATLAVVGAGVLLLLRGRPAAVGLPEPPPPPGNLFGADAGDTRVSLWQQVGPLVASPAFWLVAGMNVGLTLIRETLNFWNPTYLNEVAGFDPGAAGMASLLFPLVGAGAALAGGWLIDRTGGRFGPVVLPALAGLTAALAALAAAGATGPAAVALTCGAALFLAAPYTFCSGVLAARMGGQRAGATAAGLIDAAGYLGGVVGLAAVGRLSTSHGWGTAFAALAAVAGLTLLVGVAFAARERRGRIESPP